MVDHAPDYSEIYEIRTATGIKLFPIPQAPDER
jgi:hypothetical protein